MKVRAMNARYGNHSSEMRQPLDLEKGLPCPVCGARDWEVLQTRQQVGYIYRQRRCKNAECSHTVTTTERIIGK